MWRLLPFNIKLIVSLLLVQLIILGSGSIWLIHWNKTARIADIQYRIDIQSDFVDDLIYPSSGKLEYHNLDDDSKDVDYDYDFDHDHDAYFFLIDDKGRLVSESSGPSPDVREKIVKKISEKKYIEGGSPEKLLDEIRVGKSHWVMRQTPISRLDNGRQLLGTLYVGLNAESIFEEIEFLNRIVLFGAIAILVLTAVGSYIVVSYSTKNLRSFARELQSFEPPYLHNHLALQPHSAEEKLLFDSYAKMMESIKNSMEGQKIFIANAAHELKTPLAAAISALEVILSLRRSADDYRTTCEEVLIELRSLKRLSTTLLDIARLQHQRLGLQVMHCNFGDAITSVVNRWQRQANECDIRITTALDSTIQVAGKAEPWEVVIGNLVDNAIKYGRRGGSIHIQLEKFGVDAKFTICDNGKGMSAVELTQLGNVFFRADESRSGQEGSFGLGFAHARHIVENLGGRISVESVSDVGTTITIIILLMTELSTIC